MDTSSLSIDTRSLDKLRKTAADNPRDAAKAAAEQFEALFMQQLLKTMRASIPKSGFTDSAGEKMAQEMLDAQLTASMVGQPGGLGETLVKHLSRYMPEGTEVELSEPAGVPSLLSFRPSSSGVPSVTSAGGVTTGAGSDQSTSSLFGSGSDVSVGGLPSALLESLATGLPPEPTTNEGRFVTRLWPHARAAEQATGVPAAFVLGQAALESGWGQHEILHADGSPAHNLFGIKAGSRWQGETVDVMTTEYIDGKKTRQVERFRAYESYEASFNDWIGLMTRHPRYQDVLRQAESSKGFAQGLQAAGYATDPNYAEKLHRVIEKTIQLQKEHA